jgi:hypothetical protein
MFISPMSRVAEQTASPASKHLLHMRRTSKSARNDLSENRDAGSELVSSGSQQGPMTGSCE